MAHWYYAQNEEQHGPVTATVLKDMAQSGKLGRDDLIWREGMQRWAPARKVRGLFPEEKTDVRKRSRAAANGNAQQEVLDADSAAKSPSGGPATDVLPVEEMDVEEADADAEDEEAADVDDDSSADEDDSSTGDDDSSTGDRETAIDVLPLGGPEESKLQVPVLTAPHRAPPSQRSASDELVVFEAAESPAPPPRAAAQPSEAEQARAAESSLRRQTRIDVPPSSGGWAASIGLFLQTFTWVSCLLVILVGGVVYLSALTMTADASQRLAASGIYATFVVAAYFLARSTERICRACGQWFGAAGEKKYRRQLHKRNWERFQ